jgi:tetratricopeptide (TPR) repeat protein
MVTNAWKALEAKNYDDVTKNAQQCIDLFKQQAIDQQKALTVPPTEKAEVFAQWALNDVGTAYFILGQSYEKQNKNKEAIDAYQFLVDNLPFAQCWDPKGWFWKPAAAAKDRIKALQLDTLK